jgi:hypothetical protein
MFGEINTGIKFFLKPFQTIQKKLSKFQEHVVSLSGAVALNGATQKRADIWFSLTKANYFRADPIRTKTHFVVA